MARCLKSFQGDNEKKISSQQDSPFPEFSNFHFSGLIVLGRCNAGKSTVTFILKRQDALLILGQPYSHIRQIKQRKAAQAMI